jgi:hypothetical protein
MEPLAAAVAAARQQWGDCVPVGPSQAETEDPALIEWRETSAPWADDEYVKARAELFISALELHKALIAAQADTFDANLGALMELISTDSESADDDGEAGLADVRRAAWRSFFLAVPVVQVPFEAAEPLLGGLAPYTLGWLLAAGADQLEEEDVTGLLQCFDRAVFAGDTVPMVPRPEIAAAVGLSVPAQPTAQDLADQLVRYGTWLPGGPSSCPCDDTESRWVGLPLRVVRGQDRTTVDRRNELGYDGLLVTDRD